LITNTLLKWLGVSKSTNELTLSDFIGAVQKKVTVWTTGEAAQTTATTAGVAARTSAEQAGMISSAISFVARAIKTIISLAGETFAGVFAFLSSFLGPAAAGPAAAAEAAVLGATSLVSLASGAWELPRDTFAQLHAGEMVVPAGPAAALRASAATGGGGGAINISISAVDAQSVARLFRDHGSSLVTALRGQMRNFNR
jgi:hypothetical protein